MPRTGPQRVAVLGAGPVGLEAALQAAHAGHRVTVYERGDVAEAINQWGHVRLFTPFGQLASPLGLETIRREHPQHQLPGPTDLVTGHEYRDAYLVPLTVTAKLGDAIQTKTNVVTVGRTGVLKSDPATDPRRAAAPFRILLRNETSSERMDEADIVLDCTGTYGRHGWLGDGGIPALGEIASERHIAYGLDDVLGKRKAHYAGKSVIVVGGGYSAATTVCALAQLAEENSATWVIWLTRGPRSSSPLPRLANDPFRERDRLAAKANNLAARGDGNVEYHPQTLINEVVCHGPDKGFRVAARCNGKPMTWEVDRVIGNIGYLADGNLSREIHAGEPAGGEVKRPEPGYFVLGAKSFGRDPDFLIQRGFEQVREVMRLIGKG
jgi:thioredoxin reductase